LFGYLKQSNLTFSINLATGKELREDIIHIKASAGKLSTELKGKNWTLN
jgi:hypothetical protein